MEQLRLGPQLRDNAPVVELHVRFQRTGRATIERIDREGIDPVADGLGGEGRRPGGHIEYLPSAQSGRIQVKETRVFGKAAAKKRNGRMFKFVKIKGVHGKGSAMGHKKPDS